MEEFITKLFQMPWEIRLLFVMSTSLILPLGGLLFLMVRVLIKEEIERARNRKKLKAMGLWNYRVRG